MPVIDEITTERQRQLSVEGWTPSHDDMHSHGEMAIAAACYAAPDSVAESEERVFANDHRRLRWPWDRKWWKPSDRRRNLIKASALIVAEIERIDRIPAARTSHTLPE